jgi:hypothetical protein
LIPLTKHLLTLSSRLLLDASKREQKLLLEPRHRAMSVGGQWYTSDALGVSSQSTPTTPLALPAPEGAHPLYKEWEMFSRYLKAEDERISQDLGLVRPSSWGDTPTTATDGGIDTSAALHRLRSEVDDAIMFEEYRAKRTMGKRAHLSPSDATKQQVQAMPPMPPPRSYTIDTEAATNMSDSMTTVRPGPSRTSPQESPSVSPQSRQDYFDPRERVHSPTTPPMSHDAGRSSVSSFRSSISLSPGAPWSPSFGLGIDAPPSTVGTSPEYSFSNTLHKVLSTASMVPPIDLGPGALQYSKLCRKVDVERKSCLRAQGKDKTIFEIQKCDLFWSYRENGGISVRAMYRPRDGGKARTWTIQEFPALGPSIPLSTTIGDEVSIDFPRGSFGKLDGQWVDIRYTFANSESSVDFQTLLYTNNGKDAAELLFDRPVRTISSDKNKPECSNKNLRLWRRTEMHLEDSGPVSVDVLILLFYTSSLESKGHWVEEPHYAFEWLDKAVYRKESDHLTLKFSKEPSRWMTDKMFSQRRFSQISKAGDAPTSPVNRKRNDSMEIPGITRSGMDGSVSSSAASIKSSRSFFGRSKASTRLGNVNSFGYSKLDIEFKKPGDRTAFLDVWKKYVKPLVKES